MSSSSSSSNPFQEYVALAQEMKRLNAKRKDLKDLMAAKKESILEYMEDHQLRSVNIKGNLIRVKTVKSKPALNKAFLRESLLQSQIGPDETDELVNHILSTQESKKVEKTDVEIKLAGNGSEG